MDAIWEKHGDLIATRGDREKHIRKTYLNENPRCLGGRAVGIEGQSGSNNFGEKKNHLIKGYWKYLTKNIKASERNNPVFIMAACALDLRLENDLKSTFAVTPVREIHDYDLLFSTWWSQTQRTQPRKNSWIAVKLLAIQMHPIHSKHTHSISSLFYFKTGADDRYDRY